MSPQSSEWKLGGVATAPAMAPLIPTAIEPKRGLTVRNTTQRCVCKAATSLAKSDAQFGFDGSGSASFVPSSITQSRGCPSLSIASIFCRCSAMVVPETASKVTLYWCRTWARLDAASTVIESPIMATLPAGFGTSGLVTGGGETPALVTVGLGPPGLSGTVVEADVVVDSNGDVVGTDGSVGKSASDDGDAVVSLVETGVVPELTRPMTSKIARMRATTATDDPKILSRRSILLPGTAEGGLGANAGTGSTVKGVMASDRSAQATPFQKRR